MLRTSEWCSIPSAVLALPCGSVSITKTFRPPRVRAAARLTAVVVLPTPPFWLATVSTRGTGGRGHDSRAYGSPSARRLPRALLSVALPTVAEGVSSVVG